MRFYDLGQEVQAFTAGKAASGTAFGVDAREVGIREGDFRVEPTALMIPRQTHSLNVAYVKQAGELPDTDAVFTDQRGLCVAVKTADCIPVLLFDQRQQMVAAVHAGWRGTVGRIVEKTIRQMQSRGEDLRAVIGPGISLESFEVGDEVYEAFLAAQFPMQRIARRWQKWHLDLWEANRWLLEECGVTDIQIEGTDTKTSPYFFSARRETIKTGRNINGIILRNNY